MDCSMPLTNNGKFNAKTTTSKRHNFSTVVFHFSAVEGGDFLNCIFEIHLLQFRHKQVHLTTYDSLSRNRPSSQWRMVKGPSDEMSAAGVKMQGQKISRETERYNVQ